MKKKWSYLDLDCFKNHVFFFFLPVSVCHDHESCLLPFLKSNFDMIHIYIYHIYNFITFTCIYIYSIHIDIFLIFTSEVFFFSERVPFRLAMPYSFFPKVPFLELLSSVIWGMPSRGAFLKPSLVTWSWTIFLGVFCCGKNVWIFYLPRSGNSSALKSHRNPIGKACLPTRNVSRAMLNFGGVRIKSCLLMIEHAPRWWFQIFFYFSSLFWGNDPIWRAYFSDGLVQPPTRNARWKQFSCWFLGLETKQTKSPILQINRFSCVRVICCNLCFFHHEIQLLGNFRAIFEHLDADNSGQLDMGEAAAPLWAIDNFHCGIATMT